MTADRDDLADALDAVDTAIDLVDGVQTGGWHEPDVVAAAAAAVQDLFRLRDLLAGVGVLPDDEGGHQPAAMREGTA